MSKKIRTEAVDYLFKAILSLQDKEECYIFFEDRAEDVSGDCRQDRRIDCNDQPCESIAELWQ